MPPDGQWPEADFRRAVHRYFETMAIPLRRGRIFTDADRAGAPPVVVVKHLMPTKARILMMLALTRTQVVSDIQRIFDSY